MQDIKNRISNLREKIKSCSQLEEAIKKEANSSGGSLGDLSSESLDKKFLDDALMTSIAGISAAMKNTG